MSELKAQRPGKITSQTVMNPRENASAMTLKGSKHLDDSTNKVAHPSLDTTLEVEPSIPKNAPKVTFKELVASHPPLFPSRLAKSNKEDQEKEMLETFPKVHVNIPLLDAIKQVPRYPNFLKDLCSNKRELKGNEVMYVGENYSVVL